MKALTQRLVRCASVVAGIGALLVLQGCATPPKPYDYSAYKEAKPASILVLPPINGTPEAQATPSVMAQMTQPLAESGYYVLPVSLVDETLKSNGMHTADDAQQIPVAKTVLVEGAGVTVAKLRRGVNGPLNEVRGASLTGSGTRASIRRRYRTTATSRRSVLATSRGRSSSCLAPS